MRRNSEILPHTPMIIRNAGDRLLVKQHSTFSQLIREVFKSSLPPARAAAPLTMVRDAFQQEGVLGRTSCVQSEGGQQGFDPLMLQKEDDVSHTHTNIHNSQLACEDIAPAVRRLVLYLPCRGGPPANTAPDVALWVHPEIDEVGAETTCCLLLAGRIILNAPASARRPTPTTHLIFSPKAAAVALPLSPRL